MRQAIEGAAFAAFICLMYLFATVGEIAGF